MCPCNGGHRKPGSLCITLHCKTTLPMWTNTCRMSAVIIMKALQILTLIGLIAAAGCSTATRRVHPVTFEVRPVSSGPAEGYTPLTMLGTNRRYYVGRQVLFSNADIATAPSLPAATLSSPARKPARPNSFPCQKNMRANAWPSFSIDSYMRPLLCRCAPMESLSSAHFLYSIQTPFASPPVFRFNKLPHVLHRAYVNITVIRARFGCWMRALPCRNTWTPAPRL
jgi:hypothetical protein